MTLTTKPPRVTTKTQRVTQNSSSHASKQPHVSSAAAHPRSHARASVSSRTHSKPKSSPSSTSLAYAVKELDGQGKSPDKIIEILHAYAAARNVSIGDLIIDVIKTGVLSSTKLIEIFSQLLDATAQAGLDSAKCITGQEKGEKAFQLAAKSDMNIKAHEIAKKNAESLDEQADTEVAKGTASLTAAGIGLGTAIAESAVADVAAVAELGLDPAADELAVQLTVAAVAAGVVFASETARFAITVAEAAIKHTQAAKLMAEANDLNSNLDDMSGILKVARDGIYGGCADPEGARMAADFAISSVETGALTVATAAGDEMNPALAGLLLNDAPALVAQGLLMHQRSEYLAAHGGDVDAADNAMAQDQVSHEFIAGLAGGIAGVIMWGVNQELVAAGYNAFGDQNNLKELPAWAKVVLVIANIIVAIAATKAISSGTKAISKAMPSKIFKTAPKAQPSEIRIEMTELNSGSTKATSGNKTSGEEKAQETENLEEVSDEVLEVDANIETALTPKSKGSNESEGEDAVSKDSTSKSKKLDSKKETAELEEVSADKIDVNHNEKSISKLNASKNSKSVDEKAKVDAHDESSLTGAPDDSIPMESDSSPSALKSAEATTPVKVEKTGIKAGKISDKTAELSGEEGIKNTKLADSTNATKKSLDKKAGSTTRPGQRVAEIQMMSKVVAVLATSAERYIQAKKAADIADINVDIQEKQVEVTLHEGLLQAEKEGSQLNQTSMNDTINLIQKLIQRVQETGTQGMSDDISALEDAVSKLQESLL